MYCLHFWIKNGNVHNSTQMSALRNAVLTCSHYPFFCFCSDIANPLSIISYFIFISLTVPDNLGSEMLLQYKLFYFSIVPVERKNLKALHLYKAHTCLIILILAPFCWVWNGNQILVLKQMYHKKKVLQHVCCV